MRRSEISVFAAAALALAALVAGCGVKAGLERPPPAWGADAERYEAEKAAEKAAADAKAAEEKQKKRQSVTIPVTPPADPAPQ